MYKILQIIFFWILITGIFSSCELSDKKWEKTIVPIKISQGTGETLQTSNSWVYNQTVPMIEIGSGVFIPPDPVKTNWKWILSPYYYE